MCALNLAEQIASLPVPAGKVALFALGQAGFVFRTEEGRTLAVDPYLSDSVQRLAGFKRMIPNVLEASELKCDLLITTHEHPDHYDPDTVPIVARTSNALVAGPPECEQLWREQDLPAERFVTFRRGETRELCGFRFRTTHADHGDLSPNCCGLLLEFTGCRVFLTSDTAYRPELIPEVIAAKPDVIIPVINGRFGNLNSAEAAQLAHDVGATLAIPSHYWMFVEHGGDPGAFLEALARQTPAIQPLVLAPGEQVFL